MNLLPRFKSTLTVFALAVLALPAAQAVMISKTEFTSGKARIDADLKADKAACAPMTGNAKDICLEQAKAKEKLARAELDYSYTGKAADGMHIGVVKADGIYAVAKEQCDDQAGNAKDVCVKEAKAVHVKALAEAKLYKQVAAAKTDAAQDIRDADYKVAAEKCGAMAGDAKDSCVKAAKLKFGKS
jgi:hypothetical protein